MENTSSITTEKEFGYINKEASDTVRFMVAVCYGFVDLHVTDNGVKHHASLVLDGGYGRLNKQLGDLKVEMHVTEMPDGVFVNVMYSYKDGYFKGVHELLKPKGDLSEYDKKYGLEQLGYRVFLPFMKSAVKFQEHVAKTC